MRKTGILCDQNGDTKIDTDRSDVILRQFSEARHCVRVRQTASLPELRHDAAWCVEMRQFLRNYRMIGSGPGSPGWWILWVHQNAWNMVTALKIAFHSLSSAGSENGFGIRKLGLEKSTEKLLIL